jgi:hypothetical protein
MLRVKIAQNGMLRAVMAQKGQGEHAKLRRGAGRERLRQIPERRALRDTTSGKPFSAVGGHNLYSHP